MVIGCLIENEYTTCFTISAAVNCLLNPITPVKQNLQSTGQPHCDDTHNVLYVFSFKITHSKKLPSAKTQLFFIAFSSSDKRLKTNIQPIQDPLTKLQKIGGYTFEWIPKQGIHSHTGNDVGVIAQEIEEVLPEITTTRDNGYKAVKYEKLTAYLIECVKAQQTHIQQLEDRLVKLEKKD